MQLGLVCCLECWHGPARVVGAVKEVVDGVPAQFSRVECLAGVALWASDVVAGLCGVSKTGIASYNFQSLLLDKPQLRYTLMKLDSLEGSLGEVSCWRMRAACNDCCAQHTHATSTGPAACQHTHTHAAPILPASP